MSGILRRCRGGFANRIFPIALGDSAGVGFGEEQEGPAADHESLFLLSAYCSFVYKLALPFKFYLFLVAFETRPEDKGCFC